MVRLKIAVLAVLAIVGFYGNYVLAKVVEGGALIGGADRVEARMQGVLSVIVGMIVVYVIFFTVAWLMFRTWTRPNSSLLETNGQ